MAFRYFIFVLAICFAVDSLAADNTAVEPNKLTNSIPNSTNQIIKLGDRGISPQVLNMKVNDSVVFMLNDTSESLATVEIDFGNSSMHCSGSNLRADTKAGKVRSTRPFGPRDFAATCFHEAGNFTYKVFGLPANPSGLTGIVHVE